MIRMRQFALFGGLLLAAGVPGTPFAQEKPAAVGTQVRAGAPVEAHVPELPPIKPLFDYPLRDTSIAVGHDGAYYLTGTTGYPDWWAVTGDIQVWRSADLEHWAPVAGKPRERSVVWNVDRDGTWEKRIPIRDGAPFRPLWAPEISFLKGTYWIAYSIPYGVGGGLLKSTSGKPEGPYVAMFRDVPAVDAIDLSLFEDDGKVYLVWGAGNIRQLNDALDGFVGEAWKLIPADAPRIGFEGTFVFKANGHYYITGAEFVRPPAQVTGPEDYHCYAAMGPSLHGPFGPKFLAIPHGGHNSFFRDSHGDWWATIFGNDPRAPFQTRPGALKIRFLPDGRFTFSADQPGFISRGAR
jgi:xylan 1,4-beta-xylosidase